MNIYLGNFFNSHINLTTYINCKQYADYVISSFCPTALSPASLFWFKKREKQLSIGNYVTVKYIRKLFLFDNK